MFLIKRTFFQYEYSLYKTCKTLFKILKTITVQLSNYEAVYGVKTK